MRLPWILNLKVTQMVNHKYSLKERKLQREIKREEERKQKELGEGDSVADKAAAEGNKTNYFDIAEGIKDSGGGYLNLR